MEQEQQPEIVEDFDREVYGWVPKNIPKVKWEVVSTTNEMNGSYPVITKKLVRACKYNSSYPSISVNIDLILKKSTPANATGPVPVIMEFGFLFPPGFRMPAAPV